MRESDWSSDVCSSDLDIQGADALILAADIAIENAERFEGIPRIEVPVQLALKDPKSIFAKVPNRG
jgi:PTS system fructose-specific IIB component